MVRVQWVVCSACGHGHTFALPAGDAMARAYGYTCPETNQPAAIGPCGHWRASEHPAPGAVALSPLGIEARAPTA